MLALTQTDYQRTAESGADDLARVPCGDHREPVRSFEARQGALDRAEEAVIRLQLARDQVSDDLRIGLAGEYEPLMLQLAPQQGVILDHSVVHHGHAETTRAAAQMRVGVAVVRRPVRRPAGMADAAGAGCRL